MPRSPERQNLMQRTLEELARRPLFWLTFAAPLEAHFNADTRRARAWNIRLTVPLGLAAYLAFTLTDGAILPDLGWVPVALPVGLIVPIGLFAMWMCGWASARFREGFICFGIVAALVTQLLFIGTSHALWAPFTMLVVLLGSMFGNVTIRLRFAYACVFSGVNLLAVGLLLVMRHDYTAGVRGTLAISTVTAIIFGLVANNQLERAERRSFLLNLREMIRTEQLTLEKADLSMLSMIDPLTQLYNRRAFDVRLAELLALQQAGVAGFSLVLIDVDHFKRFNDFYGHPAGDECLACVAGLLREAVLRRQDMVARYGGEEFAVLLADCGAADAAVIAQTLCDAVSSAGIAHANREDGESVATISIGVTTTGPHAHYTGVGEILNAADRNLYAAKRSGRNRMVAMATATVPGAG